VAEEAGSRGRRRVLLGRVVSDKMDKTVVVAVERITAHPLYKKRLRRTKKYKAHDPGNEARVGDWVRIRESRPLSKDKRWRLVEIVRRGHAAVEVARHRREEEREEAEVALPARAPGEEGTS
jgi:small subunit ribosomal protein S17